MSPFSPGADVGTGAPIQSRRRCDLQAGEDRRRARLGRVGADLVQFRVDFAEPLAADCARTVGPKADVLQLGQSGQ